MLLLVKLATVVKVPSEGDETMDRRDALKSVLYGLAGVGWATGYGRAALVKRSPRLESVSKATAKNEPYIETLDSARLFYREWGSGDPVLFVHSWAVNADLWQYQMIYLAAQKMRCVAYDQRGHGRSSDPGKGYEYDTLS